jgi:hypothetical protein
LLVLDIDNEEETLVTLVEVTVDDLEETDELLALPAPTLDELFDTTVPPVHPVANNVIVTSKTKARIDRHWQLFMMLTISFNHLTRTRISS